MPLPPSPESYDRIRRRAKYFRKKNFLAALFREHGETVAADHLQECQETEQVVFCTHCGGVWHVVSKCRSRVCPLCGYELAKERAKYLLAMTHHMAHPKLLTLTIERWLKDPHDGVRYLKKCFTKLRGTKLFKPCVGGAYQIELKRKPDGWHIHVHALLDCPYMPYQKIFSAWRSIAGIDVPQVDIRSAADPKAREYVCKYASKSAGYDSNPEDMVAWYRATKGERLWGTFGKWYNAKIQDLDPVGFVQLPPKECPFCKSIGTTMLARAGPFIYPPEDWRVLAHVICPNGEYSRPIGWIKEILKGDPA